MGHLLLGYIFTATDGYDILWTMPQCILTLRLIGLVWDVHDGQKPAAELEKDQAKTAITDPPSLLETYGYATFFGAFLVGPQFPMVRYRQFVAGEFGNPEGSAPESIKATLARFVPGIMFLVAHCVGNAYLPTDYLLMADYRNQNLLMRLLIVGLWYRQMIFRYQAVWLITEGSCILSGVAHNGYNEHGQPLWDGVKNIHNRHFETAILFRHIAESFNYNTNLWVRQYIFKRLKFLGSKPLSQVMTLLFLALWHGLYTGYYVCFLYEFACMSTEGVLIAALDRFPRARALMDAPLVYPFTWVVQKLWIHFHCAWGFLPFAALSAARWGQIYADLWWYGYVSLGAVFIASKIICATLPRPKQQGATAAKGHHQQPQPAATGSDVKKEL